jgi:hypothetical protein
MCRRIVVEMDGCIKFKTRLPPGSSDSELDKERSVVTSNRVLARSLVREWLSAEAARVAT